MSSITNVIAMSLTDYFVILAQSQQSGGATWVEAIKHLDTGKLTIILIFGAALITAVGVALSAIIRAFQAVPDDSEELASQIAELEKRVHELERMQFSSRE